MYWKELCLIKLRSSFNYIYFTNYITYQINKFLIKNPFSIIVDNGIKNVENYCNKENFLIFLLINKSINKKLQNPKSFQYTLLEKHK